jgi:hypothetical protein
MVRGILTAATLLILIATGSLLCSSQSNPDLRSARTHDL